MKKIYQIIMFCAMVVALASCSNRDYEKEISAAVEESNFSEAHNLLKEFSKHIDELPRGENINTSKWKHKDEQMCAYSRAERQLYTTEIGFLLEHDNSANDRIIALVKEFTGRKELPWDFATSYEPQITQEELVDYLISNAINLNKDELIEKFFSAAVSWSSNGANYLLDNNVNAESLLLQALSKLGSFSVPSPGHYSHSGYSEREVENLGIKINDHNEACMYLINQAIRKKNKDLALQAQALMKEDLKLYDYDISYSSTAKDKAEEKINEAIEKGAFDE